VCAFTPQHLLPRPCDHIELVPRQRHRENCRGCVTQGETRAPLANPVAIRHPDSGGRAVPGEDHVAFEVHRREIRKPTVLSLQDAGIELELPGHVLGPALTEALPDEDLHSPRAEQ